MSIASTFTRFEHDILPRVVAPALATLLLLAASGSGARAASNVFVISDTEGYGIMDCLTDGKSCGRIVADAWCEAHGLGPANAYGRASDITAATPVSASTAATPVSASTTAPTRIPDDAMVVACGD